MTHRVSMDEHNTLLKGRGWTEEEFEAGFRQGVAPRQGSEHFIQYEALVRRELAKGEVREREETRDEKRRDHACRIVSDLWCVI